MKKILIISLILLLSSCVSKIIEKSTKPKIVAVCNGMEPEFLSCVKSRIEFEHSMGRKATNERLQYIYNTCCTFILNKQLEENNN